MTFGWNRRLGSSALLVVLAWAAGTAPAAERLAPEPGAAATAAWERYADQDAAWAAEWPADWTAAERLGDVPVDSLTTLLHALEGVMGDAGRMSARVPWSQQVRELWAARGYLACSTRLRQGDQGATLLVDPGPLHRVAGVRLEPSGDEALDRRIAEVLPAVGTACTEDVWRRAVADVLAAAGDRGFPFARWRLRAVRVDPVTRGVTVEADLYPGGDAVLGEIRSDLPPRAGRFLARASGLRPGRAFRQRDLWAARRRLEARGAWEEVSQPVVYALAADTVGVHWPVRARRRPNRFAAVLGLSRTDEEETRLSGQVQLELGNIAGTGRRLAVDWSDDAADRSHLGISWLEPLALGTPLDLEALLDQEVLQDVHTRFSLDARLRLPVAGVWGLELGVGRDRGTYPQGEWTRSTRWRSRAALLRRWPDRRRGGWGGSFAVEDARRAAEIRPVADGDAGAVREERQTLVRVELEGELRLSGALGLGGRAFYAGVEGDGTDRPLAEQERLGGARTLRGYREDRFHGDRVGSLQLELRLGRPGGSRLYSFLDLGYVRLARRDPETGGTVESVTHPRGYGVGLETVGMGGDISLAVGFPDAFTLDEAKLHVSLLQAF